MRPKTEDPRIELISGHLKVKFLFFFLQIVIKLNLKLVKDLHLQENVTSPKRALNHFKKADPFHKVIILAGKDYSYYAVEITQKVEV
jgi:hypothetical protein